MAGIKTRARLLAVLVTLLAAITTARCTAPPANSAAPAPAPAPIVTQPPLVAAPPVAGPTGPQSTPVVENDDSTTPQDPEPTPVPAPSDAPADGTTPANELSPTSNPVVEAPSLPPLAAIPPGTVALINGMSEALATDLVASGLTADQAALVVESAQGVAIASAGTIGAISLRLAGDPEAAAAPPAIVQVAPALVEGATKVLGAAGLALTDPLERGRIAGVVAASLMKSLKGRTTELSAADATALRGVMAATGVAQLDAAGLTGDTLTKGAASVVKGAVSALAASDSPAGETDAVLGTITQRSIASLRDAGATEDGAVINGAAAIGGGVVAGLDGAGLTTAAAKAATAGLVSGQALAGLNASGVTAAATIQAGGFALVARTALVALKDAGLADADVAAGLATAADMTVRALGAAGLDSSAQYQGAVGQLTRGAAVVLGAVTLDDNTDVAASLAGLTRSTIAALHDGGLAAGDIGATAGRVVENASESIQEAGVTGNYDIVSTLGAVARSGAEALGGLKATGVIDAVQTTAAAGKVAAGATGNLGVLARDGLLSDGLVATAGGAIMEKTLAGLALGGIAVDAAAKNAIAGELTAAVQQGGVTLDLDQFAGILEESATAAQSFSEQLVDPNRIGFQCDSFFGPSVEESNFLFNFKNSLTKNYSGKVGFVLCKAATPGACPAKRAVVGSYVVKWNQVGGADSVVCESAFREAKPHVAADVVAKAQVGLNTLSWDPQTTPLSKIDYIVETTPNEGHQVLDFGIGQGAKFLHTDLAECRQYTYRVRVRNWADESAWSTPITIRALPHFYLSGATPFGKIALTGDLRPACATKINLHYATEAYTFDYSGMVPALPLATILASAGYAGKLENVTLPFDHTDLIDGSTYHYVATAVIDGVETDAISTQEFVADFHLSPIPVPEHAKFDVTAPFFAMGRGDRPWIPHDDGCMNVSLGAMKPNPDAPGSFIGLGLNSPHTIELASDDADGRFYASTNCTGQTVTSVPMENSQWSHTTGATLSYRAPAALKTVLTFASDGFDGATWTLTPAVDVAAGKEHACALLSDTRVACWGFNGGGQLGLGFAQTWDPHRVPAYVQDANTGQPLTGVTALRSASYSTCAITGGAIKCWGSTFSNSANFIAAFGTDNVAVAFTGSQQMCAVKASSGKVACRGPNNYGQLGDGTKVDSLTDPVFVRVAQLDGSGNPQFNADDTVILTSDDLADATDVRISDNHTCALETLAAGGKIYCWGVGPGTMGLSSSHVLYCPTFDNYPDFGFGNGPQYYPYLDYMPAAMLVRSSETSNPPLANMIALGETRSSYGCAVAQAGDVRCWGGYLPQGYSGTHYAAPFKLFPGVAEETLLTGATDLSVGRSPHVCVLHDGQATVGGVAKGGMLACVGYDNNGQLGHGTGAAIQGTVATPGWVRIGYSQVNAEALPSGIDPLTDKTTTRLYGVSKVSAGDDQTCAVVRGGVFCWGRRSGLGLEGSAYADYTTSAIWAGSSPYYSFYLPSN